MKKIFSLFSFAIILVLLSGFFALRTFAIGDNDTGGGGDEIPPLPLPILFVNKIVNSPMHSVPDFSFSVENNSSGFSATSSGEFILQPGTFIATSTDPSLYPLYQISYSDQCNGSVVRGDYKICTITYNFRLEIEQEVIEETAPNGSNEPVVSGGGGSGYQLYEVLINNNASETDSPKVILNLTATNASEMLISNSSTFEDANWEPFVGQKDWTLESQDGVKQVYAQFRGAGSGGQGSDDILLKNKVESSGAATTPTEETGQVLGATTDCGFYLNSYLKYGAGNDVNEVKKLQRFFNDYFQSTLPITGFFGPLTLEVVKRFQLKYSEEILNPWIKEGLLESGSPTGFVYKTTKRWIDMMVCPSLKLPIPEVK